ncbi:hypothetical protein [Mesorhizobium sp. INR15]|uniref:hypothetical protein n=1 Tax=Mesorhizobium sp. INR15 TaxID=2654248 RepID=UPI00189648B2|nr:hypothetical protein [Mesorhizobium sp. INR15]QPC91923.1 hypothetical protein GA829_15770 [Mesorhizobium sp. INR15]
MAGVAGKQPRLVGLAIEASTHRQLQEKTDLMDVPESMKAELATWNHGAGISLEGWISCMGGFSLAVGYSTVFWPGFVAFERYILLEGFSKESLRGFERGPGATRQSVEAVMNHLHLADIHGFHDGIAADKLIFLGTVLRQIYQAKLQWQFPDRRFVVELFIPETNDIEDYQLSFWQAD